MNKLPLGPYGRRWLSRGTLLLLIAATFVLLMALQMHSSLPQWRGTLAEHGIFLNGPWMPLESGASGSDDGGVLGSLIGLAASALLAVLALFAVAALLGLLVPLLLLLLAVVVGLPLMLVGLVLLLVLSPLLLPAVAIWWMVA